MKHLFININYVSYMKHESEHVAHLNNNWEEMYVENDIS